MNDVLAIDPGLATGACLIRPDGTQLLRSDELTEEQFAPWVRHYLEFYTPDTLSVVCERFTITADTAKKSQAPFSLELIGVLKQCCRDNGYPLPVLQTPADAKNFAPNARLKNLGLWHRGGGGHALDAIRHAVLYMARNGWKNPALLQD